mmetsp:Transcript_1292/g.2788  ORF Transcript_1292/g.2788 Transcript_1292/m.2788 type:complete len:227 (+) Transcript_1292:171-851(+)
MLLFGMEPRKGSSSPRGRSWSFGIEVIFTGFMDTCFHAPPLHFWHAFGSSRSSTFRAMPQPPHCHRVLLAKHSLSSWPSSSQRCLQRRESVVLLHCLHFQALTFIDFTCSILSAILSLTSSSASFLCRFAALSSSTRWEKRDSCLRTVLPPPPLAANSASCFATRFPYCASIAFVSFAKSFVVFAAPCFFPAPPDSAATLAEMTGGALPGGIRRSLAAPPPPPPPP